MKGFGVACLELRHIHRKKAQKLNEIAGTISTREHYGAKWRVLYDYVSVNDYE